MAAPPAPPLPPRETAHIPLLPDVVEPVARQAHQGILDPTYTYDSHNITAAICTDAEARVALKENISAKLTPVTEPYDGADYGTDDDDLDLQHALQSDVQEFLAGRESSEQPASSSAGPAEPTTVVPPPVALPHDPFGSGHIAPTLRITTKNLSDTRASFGLPPVAKLTPSMAHGPQRAVICHSCSAETYFGMLYCPNCHVFLKDTPLDPDPEFANQQVIGASKEGLASLTVKWLSPEETNYRGPRTEAGSMRRKAHQMIKRIEKLFGPQATKGY